MFTLGARARTEPCPKDKKTVAITKPEASPWFEIDLGAEAQARERQRDDGGEGGVGADFTLAFV